MNGKVLNIAAVALLLSGCNSTKSRTDSKGETVGRNAPVFITPKANPVQPNKAEPVPTAAKPAVVNFNAEKYIMVKESDLNKLVTQKTNEILRNKGSETHPNTNEKSVNKQPGDPVETKPTEISNQQNEPVLTVETVKLEPVKNTNNPIFSFLMTFLIVLAFTLAVGYFFFFKKKNVKSSEATEPVVPDAPTPAPAIPQTVVTPAAQENPINAAVQGASQAATLGVTAAVVANTLTDQNTQ